MPLHLQSLQDFWAGSVVFLILLNHSLPLALGLLNCGARLEGIPAPVLLATKMSASKLIHFFSSHFAAFGFRSSTPPDNTTLTPANRKADQNFRLALVLLLMPLSTWSSSFLTSELPLLIQVGPA